MLVSFSNSGINSPFPCKTQVPIKAGEYLCLCFNRYYILSAQNSNRNLKSKIPNSIPENSEDLKDHGLSEGKKKENERFSY